MKLIKTLFLFGFIILYDKVTNNPVAFNTDHISSVAESKIHGVLIRTIGDPAPYKVRGSLEEVLQIIKDAS